MSLFEHYPRELHELEAEIRHYGAICSVDVTNKAVLEQVVHDHEATGARGTLRALLILQMKVETGMMDAGMTPE